MFKHLKGWILFYINNAMTWLRTKASQRTWNMYRKRVVSEVEFFKKNRDPKCKRCQYGYSGFDRVHMRYIPCECVLKTLRRKAKEQLQTDVYTRLAGR